MHVIVEGLDRTGKSTLVNQIRNHLEFPMVVHSSSPPKGQGYDWEFQYYRRMARIMFNQRFTVSPMNMILDRFHFGTGVYGTKYRNYTDRQVYDLFDEVESYLPNTTVLIMLVDDPKEIARRDDGDSIEKSVEEYAATKQSFEKAFSYSGIQKKLRIHITDNGGFVNTLPTVLKFIEEN